jgi:hypothetical protein
MKSAAIRIMGNIHTIRLYDIFRKDLHLPDERAYDLVQAINETVKEGYEENLKRIATKEFAKDQVMKESQSIKEFMKSQNYATKEFVKDEINRVELKVEQTKSELTKSIFWTSIVQFLAIIGAVIGIISFMFRK